MNEFFPQPITGLPEADVPFQGVKGWLSQGSDHQVVFFEIEAIGEVAPHTHGAQWGTVFKGEMDPTIGGITKTYQKGDTYFIPAGVEHAAVFRQKTWLMDFFAERQRYSVKP